VRANLLKGHIEYLHISQSKVAFGQMYQFLRFRMLQVTAEDYARRRLGLIESGIIYLWNAWKNRVYRGMILSILVFMVDTDI